MNKLFQILKVLFDREERIAYTLSEFAHQNKDMLIIVADPKTDKLFVGYKDKHVLTKINSAEGRDLRVVRNVLKRSTFQSNIDYLQVALIEVLKVPLKNKYYNQFMQWLDGALYNIGVALARDKKHPERLSSTPAPTKGEKAVEQKTGIPSPFMNPHNVK